MERLDFNRSATALKPLATGAAAHMSLHLNRQCQRADASLSRLTPGHRLRVKRDTTRPGKPPCPVGEGGIYGGVPHPSTPPFRKSFPSAGGARGGLILN